VQTQAGQTTTRRPAVPPTTTAPSLYVGQIVRFIGVNAGNWKSSKVLQNYSGLYTRLELTSVEQAVGVAPGTEGTPKRDYSAESRPWYSRLFYSKTNTVTVTTNVSVHDPALKIAIPLFSISHASGLRLGNTWNTDYTASSDDSPLFLIGPNTRLAIHLSAKVSSELKSQGTSLALQALSAAIKVASPTSSLLTTLSSHDVNNKATAIDTAISSLTSSQISEDIDLGRLADSWAPHSSIELSGCAPFVRTDGSTSPSSYCARGTDIDGGSDTEVGQWALSLACPRPSVFDSRDICSSIGAVALDKKRATALDVSTPNQRKQIWEVLAPAISDAQVLGFKLSSQVTIEDFIQSQSWFTAFTSKGTKTPNDYSKFCSGGIVSMENSGLNHFDAALVIRAAVEQLPQLAQVREQFTSAKHTKDAKECVNNLADMGITVRR
jgi:hypothetical protein